MGTYRNGILGSFTGKVGNVVGSTWNGISYMRAVPSNVKDPKTPKQLAQRRRFGLVTSFLRKFKPIVTLGFKNGAGNMTPTNRASSFNIRNAVSGEYPDQQIELEQLVLARGDLSKVDDPQAAADGPGEVTFTWGDNSGEGSALPDDKVAITIYNPERDSVIYRDDLATREDETLTHSLPDSFQGSTVETYLFMVSADESIVSDSLYTGQVTVAEEP